MHTTLETANHVNAPLPAEAEMFEPKLPLERSVQDLSFDLGLWLLSLKNFLNIHNHAFLEGSKASASSRDWTNEVLLTNTTLLQCAGLTQRLLPENKRRRAFLDQEGENFLETDAGEQASVLGESRLSPKDLYVLANSLRDCAVVCESVLKSKPVSFQSWLAWSNILASELGKIPAVEALAAETARAAESYLPAQIVKGIENKKISLSRESDLRIALPFFGRLLKFLSVIENMLVMDKPLKPALLVFSALHEQTQEMIRYLNNRLLRFRDENDPLFSALDAAVYATSIEVRKIFNHELAEVSGLRATPAIRAKMEAAHGLLRESLQQSLINVAQVIDAELNPTDIFPNLRSKLEESLLLRQELWDLMRQVQASEKQGDAFEPEMLFKELRRFCDSTMRFLMYKDLETFERFVEEILRAKDRAELLQLIHRFGAYVETLFGQVNMRNLLAAHPFQFPEGAAPADVIPAQNIPW